MDSVTKKSRHLSDSARRAWRSALAAVLAVLLPALSAFAAPVTMTDIGFNALPGGKFEIRMKFDGAPPSPHSYTIDKPARIALDLPGVSSALAQKKHTLAFDNAQSVVVVESGGRTRVIVNLVEVAPYQATVEGNELVVSVGSGATGQYLTEGGGSIGTTVGTAAAHAGVHSGIKDFNFRRGANGEGRVELQLADPHADVDVRLEGNMIKVAFFDTTVPAELQRRYDVVDFATPVEMVDVSQAGSQASVGIKVTGEYDYLAYQADTEFTLSVKPLTAQEQADEQKKKFAYTGEKLSLNFQDIEVRAVLQLIADFTNLNLVASDTVTGRITLRLKNVPWDQALDLVLKTKGLDKRLVGNVLTVAPAAEIAAREKLELETNKQVNELAPLHTDFIEVRYAKAADLLAMLTGKNSILSTRGTASIDKRTNLLIVQDTDQVLAEVRSLLKRLDVPVRQVLIEARIVKARANVSKDLGIQWGGRYGDNDGNNMVIGGSGVRAGVPGPVTGGDVVNLGVTKTGTTTLNLGFVNNSNILNLSLTAIEENGDSQTLAQPKVLTADKQMAKIEQGTEIPYQEATSSGATSTSFKPAVLALEVTPQITPDNRIIMDLQVNQDVPGAVTNGIPSIDTTRIKTQVLVDNGQTVVLGGIYTQDDTFTETKTPLLGDVPYVGSLFKRTSKGKIKSELLIFITPRLDGEGKSSLQ